MGNLILLDLEGKPILPSSIPPGVYSPDSKKILILGDGYTSHKQRQFKNHVRHLIKTIISTYPFLMLKSRAYANYKYLTKIMFFRADAISQHWGPDIINTTNPVKYPLTPGHDTKFKIRLDLVKHKILPDLSYTVTGDPQIDATEIINFINSLNHRYPILISNTGNPLSASDIWLDQRSDSYGLVSIITPYPADVYIGNSIRPLPVWSPSLRYFPASFSVANMRVPYWPYFTLHEIGHSFRLEDEYDFGPDDFPDNRLTPLATGFRPPGMSPGELAKWLLILQAPNLLFRSQLLDSNLVRNNEPSELQVSDININNIKKNKKTAWFNCMSVNDKFRLNVRYRGYYSYKDFWQTSATNNVRRDTTNCPVAEPNFPQQSGIEATEAVLKNHPTVPGFDVWRFPYASSMNRVLLVEGATNNQRNIYRPNLECIMRIPTPIDPQSADPIHHLPSAFCKVCANHIKQKLKL